MEYVLSYSLPMLISFLLMNKCYKHKKLNYPTFAALGCLIPVVNWVLIFYYIYLLLWDTNTNN